MDGEDQFMPDVGGQNGFADKFSGIDGHGGDGEEEEEESELDMAEGFPIDLRRDGLLPTGCCYDDRMKLHANADFGAADHHPEDPARIEAIMRTFKKAGLVFTGKESQRDEAARKTPLKYMWRIRAREATRAEICLVHTPGHYDWVERLSSYSTAELRILSAKMDGSVSLYVGSLTYEAALISAGGAIETCKAVVTGEVKNAIAVIRPPGHHAEHNKAMGFCFFNNVPIATKVCQIDYPTKCRKVLILDWDVHHGNGTQNMMYEDPNVLYISLHVWQNGSFYPPGNDNPMIPDGGMENCGAGPGLGRNVNIPWQDQGMGDAEYMAAFQQIVMPIAYEFNPDLVIVSAGFDAAAGDMLGGCFVSPDCYAHMTHMLMSLAGGKIAVCLEGGYSLEAISKSALAVARTLMGEPPPPMDLPRIDREAARILSRVQGYQAPYWECMRPGVVDQTYVPPPGIPSPALELGGVESSDGAASNGAGRGNGSGNEDGTSRGLFANALRSGKLPPGAEPLYDVLRAGQQQVLQAKHGMIPLYLQREKLPKWADNSVLVTRDVREAKKLLVIIHNPPSVTAQPDLFDSALDPGGSWMVDGVSQYIDWAVGHGFGVVDIDVPHTVSHRQAGTINPHAFDSRQDESVIVAELKALMTFVWDNYIQLYEKAQDIFFMGVGSAYLGIRSLLLNRDVAISRISGVVAFIDEDAPLRKMRSNSNPSLAGWYRAHSQVYISASHSCWGRQDLSEDFRKRRFGAVVRSNAKGLPGLLNTHREDVHKWIDAHSTASTAAVAVAADGKSTDNSSTSRKTQQ